MNMRSEIPQHPISEQQREIVEIREARASARLCAPFNHGA
jgi:hypothetical protein